MKYKNPVLFFCNDPYFCPHLPLPKPKDSYDYPDRNCAPDFGPFFQNNETHILIEATVSIREFMVCSFAFFTVYCKNDIASNTNDIFTD